MHHMLCQCVPHVDLLIDMPDGRVMFGFGVAAEPEFPASEVADPNVLHRALVRPTWMSL